MVKNLYEKKENTKSTVYDFFLPGNSLERGGSSFGNFKGLYRARNSGNCMERAEGCIAVVFNWPDSAS